MVASFSRDEFLERKLDYNAGESVGIYGPTGYGKTFLGYQVAEVALNQNPGMSFTSYLPKGNDSTTYAAAERMGLKITHEWPPRKKWFEEKPRGHVFQPPHVVESADADIEYISRVMKDAINSNYWKGNNLGFVDDAFLIESKYGAAPEVEQNLVAGRSNKSGIIFSLQAPKGSVRSGVSSFHFSQPMHMLFAREDVQANRERYGEISMGIDPNLIDSIVRNLRTYPVDGGNASEFLYLHRATRSACIVRPW